MSGHRRSHPGRRMTAFLAATSLAALGSLLIGAGPASAADTVKAQLTLSGVASSKYPTGGSTVGVHPGDTVSISSLAVPSAGLPAGLDDLVGGLLNTLATYQVDVDFSKLPGGKADTVLKGKDVKSFTFPKAGTYTFTWSAQTIGLLGGAVPLNLDGNQLAAAKVKLNAKNQYVGQILVAKDLPAGGVALQLPGVSVQPSLPVVGDLPKVGLPGLTTPTLPVSVPDLNPVKKPTGGSTATTKAPAPTTGVLPVPAMVVPQGTGKVYSGSGGDYTSNSLSGSTTQLPGTSLSGAKVSPGASPSTGATATANSTGRNKTINLAADRPSSAAGLPVVLAIVAMVALVLVAGTYARLFLLRKN